MAVMRALACAHGVQMAWHEDLLDTGHRAEQRIAPARREDEGLTNGDVDAEALMGSALLFLSRLLVLGAWPTETGVRVGGGVP